MVRAANKRDIPLIKFLLKLEPGFWDDSWREDAIDIGIQSAKDLCFVWEEGSHILGFVCAHDLGFRAYLSELIVSPEKRKSGIGTALVKEVQKVLVQKGCKILIVDAWRGAVDFYHNLDFSEPDAKLLRVRL